MPYIALMVCIVFVFKLLKLDRQASPNLSKALWIPSVWFLYCATRPLDEWFHSGQLTGGGETAESGSFVDRYFLTVLIIIALVILTKRRINWRQTIKNNSWLCALFFFMLVSILWSDFVFVSFKRWIRTVGTMIMALVVLSESEPYEAMHSIIRRVLYIVIPLSAMLVKYYPGLGISFGRWSGQAMYTGATNNKNTLGEICSLWIFLFIWTIVVRRDEKNTAQAVKGETAFGFIVLFLALFLMKGPSGYGASAATYSASSIAVLVVGLAIFFTLRRFKSRLDQLGRVLVIMLVGAGLLAGTMDLLDISPTALIAGALGRKADLTGRADLIWPVLLPIAWQNPVLGAGYGSSWIKPVPGLTLDINEAHNGYLDVFLELGVAGLVLLALTVMMYLKKAMNEFPDNFHWAAFRISYLVMFLCHNWTETTLLRSREILWSLFVLFTVGYPHEWTGLDRRKNVPAENTDSRMESDSETKPATVSANPTVALGIGMVVS